MKSEITTFLKTYFLNILLIVVFVGIFIFTQFVHNEDLYKWLFIDTIAQKLYFSLEKEILDNNKYPLQDFLFCIPLIVFSVLVDYFRSLFYPRKYLMRVFIACGTLFILFILNWMVFELFGNTEHYSLYYYERPGLAIIALPTSYFVNILLVINFGLLFLAIGLVYVIEKQPIVQRFNSYIKGVIPIHV